MKPHAFTLLAVAALACSIAELRAEPVLAAASLIGKTREQLRPTFPGEANRFEPWNGFATLVLGFNGVGHLSQVSAAFVAPTAEGAAVAAVSEKFGIDLSHVRPVRAAAVLRYENVNTTIRTVSFMRALPRQGIGEVTITYRLDYNQ